jgi:RNA polymerase sigma-70 factor (ECF subfamily)
MVPEHLLDPQDLGDHVDRLYRAAWALCGSREDAEDLVQDTFARVLARPRVVRGDDDIGYLLRVLRNTFISKRRTASRRPAPAGVAPEELELPDTGGPGRAVQPETAAGTKEVFEAIAALPDDFRDALTAIDVVGLSYAEAAKVLRVREGTVTSRLYRARAQVVKALGATSPR